MPFHVVRGDITKMHVDAIVNTANCRPIVGSGVDTAIHSAAGPALLEARKKIGSIPRGCSAITSGFNLGAKYVIHTVSTRWRDGYHGEMVILRSCYMTALKLAVENSCQSIAFPVLAAGNFGFPRDIAMTIAGGAFQEFLSTHDELQIYLVVFGDKSYLLSKALFKDMKAYIDETQISGDINTEDVYSRFSGVESYLQKKYPLAAENRTEELLEYAETLSKSSPMPVQAAEKVFQTLACPEIIPHGGTLQEQVASAGETFQQVLRRLVIASGLSNKEIYSRAYMSKQLFNNAFNQEGYQPSKKTALLFALALQLNLEQTQKFIGKAGYTLSGSNKTDIIVSYFIAHGKHNIYDLDCALCDFGEDAISNSIK